MTPHGVDAGFSAAAAMELPRALDLIAPTSTIGIGSLPHRNAAAAAEFVFNFYDVPSAPSLPRRSPAESAMAQALAGAAGVTFGQYGALAVDVSRLDPGAPVTTDFNTDGFVGFAAFVKHAVSIDYRGPVKWHFIGPVSVGMTLVRAGADPDTAFRVALHVVREHMLAMASHIAQALPHCPQLVMVNEPMLERDAVRELDISLLTTADLVSSAMASVERVANVGVHCCRGVDLDLLFEAGPHIVSLAANESVLNAAGVIGRFLDHGGWFLWGAIATEGPIGVTAKRSWHQLMEVWHGLGRRGVDVDLLIARSLFAPQCGLGSHSPAVAERVCRSLHDLAQLVRSSSAFASS